MCFIRCLVQVNVQWQAILFIIIFFLLWVWGTHFHKLTGKLNHIKLQARQQSSTFYEKLLRAGNPLAPGNNEFEHVCSQIRKRKWTPMTRTSFKNEKKSVRRLSCLIVLSHLGSESVFKYRISTLFATFHSCDLGWKPLSARTPLATRGKHSSPKT